MKSRKYVQQKCARRIYEGVASSSSQEYVLKGYHHVRRFEQIMAGLKEILHKNKMQILQIIDIGCGDGFLYELIMKHLEGLVEIVGVDISLIRLKRARQRVPGSSFVCADIKYLPFRKLLSIAIASQLIEHLRHPEVALREVHRILVDRGFLILDTPSQSNIIDMVLGLIGKKPTWGLRLDSGHVAFYNEESIKTLLHSAGFKTLDVKGVSILRYDLLSLLSITWDKRKWLLPRLLDSFAHKSCALRGKGSIQVFLCQST